jgi:hypothetical protein
MAIAPQHELHRRRMGRNIGLAAVLVGMIVIVFGLTVVKVTRGDPMAGFDHVVEPRIIPQEDSE